MDYSKLSDKELLELASQTPSLSEVILAWRQTPESEREKALVLTRGAKCREVSEEAYKNLYWCLTKREYPDSHLPVLRGLLKAYKERRGVMIQAWRGFGKSTDLLVWVLLLLGNNPVGSMAFIRVNDTKAQEAGDAVATIVESSYGWKAAFPNVVPDEKQGWSKKAGFFVLDTNVCPKVEGYENTEAYSKWREACFADHISEPSLICAGIESGMIIGLHPTNGEWFDDLHDEMNTRSKTEMKGVVDAFEGNILPTWTDPKRPMMFAVVCTPWDSDNDVYHAMLQSGLLELVKIPIFEFDDNGEVFTPLNRKVKLTWADVYDMPAVMRIWNSQQMNPRRFWQMFLLDDKAGRANASYKWFPMKASMVDWTWQVVGGVDPVFTDKPDGAVSTFALCLGLRMPSGGVVIAGGVLEKCSALEGDGYIVQAQNTYPNYHATWCTKYGGDEVFIQMVRKNPGVRIYPIEKKYLPQGNKKFRQYEFLQRLLASGYVYIVDDDENKYLKCIISYLEKYPNILDDEAPEWDAADALVACLYGFPDIRYKAVNTASEEALHRSMQQYAYNYNPLRPPRIAWNEWRG